MMEMAQSITKLPVRIGVPAAQTGFPVNSLVNPSYATSVGMVLWSMNHKGTSKWFDKPTGLRGFFSSLVNLFK